MQIVVMGSAAGGGFPQWNCNCRNCYSLRHGNFLGPHRTQTQVAISNDGHRWFLLGASPDLRIQIESTPALHPQGGNRNSPIAGVLLINADIDHVVGLLSLRELHQFRIYCPDSLRHILQEDNSIFGMLSRVPQQACWMDAKVGEGFHLQTVSGDETGISCELFPIGYKYPAYVPLDRRERLKLNAASLGAALTSARQKRLVFLPAVPSIDDGLLQKLEMSDLILFDGTFWSDDELIRVQGGGPSAREMGHVPVAGSNGTLSRLWGLLGPQKVFLHINNTNPMLDPTSSEHKSVTEAGWRIAEDGWHFEL